MGSRAGEVLSSTGQSLWQLMPREISMEQQLWCVELSCLSSGLEPVSDTLKVVYSTLFGLLLNVLAPLMAIREIPQEPICGWPHSEDMAF